MNDLISRQAAIEALKAIKYGLWEIDIPFPSCPEYVEKHIQIKEMMEIVDGWMKKLMELPPVQPERKKDEWISCKKKPPEDFEWVYAQTIYGEPIVTKYVPPKIKPESHPHGYWGDTDCFEYDYFDVVAWKPLPEPWEGEQNE